YSRTAAGILTLEGTDLVPLTSPVTPIHLSVLKKSTDTVLMALGRKGLTLGAIIVQGVFYIGGRVSVLPFKHSALDGCAAHSHPKQCALVDREENC
ncbi:unnamed protein product, partial [Staurois parvus]